MLFDTWLFHISVFGKSQFIGLCKILDLLDNICIDIDSRTSVEIHTTVNFVYNTKSRVNNSSIAP